MHHAVKWFGVCVCRETTEVKTKLFHFLQDKPWRRRKRSLIWDFRHNLRLPRGVTHSSTFTFSSWVCVTSCQHNLFAQPGVCPQKWRRRSKCINYGDRRRWTSLLRLIFHSFSYVFFFFVCHWCSNLTSAAVQLQGGRDTALLNTQKQPRNHLTNKQLRFSQIIYHLIVLDLIFVVTLCCDLSVKIFSCVSPAVLIINPALMCCTCGFD